MKKLVLFAAAGLLTTASIVYASVAGEKKSETVKKETVKKETKPKFKKSKCSGYFSRSI